MLRGCRRFLGSILQKLLPKGRIHQLNENELGVVTELEVPG